jgi:hypothetical protein
MLRIIIAFEKTRGEVMMSRSFAVIMAIGVSASLAGAQYRVVPGRVNSDGFPTTPASVCLSDTGTAHCYTPPEYDKNSPFGLDPRTETIGHLDGKNLTLFTARFSAANGNDATNYALLMERDGEFVNLLPKMQLTNQSDFQIWNLLEFSDMPMLLTADFIWDPYGSHAEGDTRFGNHQYTIHVLIFDHTTGRYVERIQYVTEKYYRGLDALDSIRIIDPEKKKILLRLRKGPSH